MSEEGHKTSSLVNKIKGVIRMTGKEKCKILKDVRKDLADKLKINIDQRECTYKGECKGTCPK